MVWDATKSPGDLITAGDWNDMVADQKGRVIGTNVTEAIADTSANLPSAGSSGRLLFETDTGRVLYDNGTSLVEVGLSESQISLSNLSSNSYADLSDGSSFPIPNADLNNSSLTVGNTSISLGGSGTPNVTDLNGSEGNSGQFLQTDGSNLSFSDVSSFSGDFNDLTNVPTLPEGISAEQIFEQNADAIRQAAEARHAAGLSQVEADGGFFDAFVNSNKVASKSKTEVKSQKAVLDLLQGNVLTGNVASSQNIKTNAGNENQVKFNIDDNITSLGFKVDIVSKPLPELLFRVGNFADEEVAFSKNQDTIATQNDSTKLATSFQAKQYKLVMVSAGGGQTDVFLDGVLEATINFDLTDLAKQEFIFNLKHDFASSGQAEVNITDISDQLVLESQGVVTEQQFTFTDTQGNAFSPSKVGIFPDQTLNGQSITYDLKDSNGNVVKTFNQNDLNQLQSVNTTDTTFQVEANLSGNGSQTPELEFLDVRGV